MSIEYWPIVIYGAKIEQSMFDPQKMAELIGLESEEGVVYRNDFHDFLDELIRKKDYIEWLDSAEMEEGVYIGLLAGFPWQFNSNAYRGLTADKIKEDVWELIRPYVKESIDAEDLMEKIDYYEAVGCA